MSLPDWWPVNANPAKPQFHSLAETLVNGLVDRIYIRFESLNSHSLVVDIEESEKKLNGEAASCAFIASDQLGKLLPANLLVHDGTVGALSAGSDGLEINGNTLLLHPLQSLCSQLMDISM
uniref:BPI2 domain-containing protein n=1 Tax=Angiostrongylus cantonensis TaxID=6313 RepID=A0A0K0DHS7_ANGCA